MNIFIKLLFIIFIFFYIFYNSHHQSHSIISNLPHKILRAGSNKSYSNYYSKNTKINDNHLVLKISCDILKNKYNINIFYKITDYTIQIYYNNKYIRFKHGYNNLKRKFFYKNNKVSISNKLKKYNFPVPKNQIINKIQTINHINYIINNLNISYPLVIKPVDGNNAYNVFTNISNNYQLKNILINKFLNKKLKRCKVCNIMLEEHLYGNQYRILMYKNYILDITQLIPPYIIGDGINSIKHLIFIENNKQINKKYPLIIDKHFLQVKNLNINSILNKGQKFIINLPKGRLGCFYKRINIKNIHKDNITMFKKLYKIAGFDFIGVDFIINNLHLSYKHYTNKHSGINELNSSPSIATHYYSKGLTPNYNVPINFLIHYFKINKQTLF